MTDHPNQTPDVPTASSRRSFLTKPATFAAGAVALAALAAPKPALAVTPALTFADIPGTGDVKVLNFALALEALETELYRQALARLTNGGRTPFGERYRGFGINPNQPDVLYVREYGEIERQHRDFIDNALGAESLLRRPPFNRARFDFGIQRLDRGQVMNLVYTAELTGVGAYLGAIPFFETGTFLQIAASIQGTEARHTAVLAAVLRALFGQELEPAPLFDDNDGIDRPVPPNTVLANVSPFIVL